MRPPPRLRCQGWGAYSRGVPEVSAPESEPAVRPRRVSDLAVVATLVVGAAVARPLVGRLLDGPGLRSWTTIFVAVCIQALPFLVLGVTVSGAIAAWVSPAALARALPARPALAVPVAAAAGVALPGCECGSVPIAGRLVDRGVASAPALTFMLAAPAVNPVVLVATAVAFPGRPVVVLARFVASLLAACAVGLAWAARGDDGGLAAGRRRRTPGAGPAVRATGPDQAIGSTPGHQVAAVATAAPSASRRQALGTFVATAQHDFLHAGGFLIVGAATAASLQTLVPRTVLDQVGHRGVLGVAALAVLAVVLAVCSEADAFVAASLTQFSLTARLAFMVVGPMVDVKLVALQAGTFGRRFATRFAPLTFALAVAAAVLVGTVLL